MSFWFLIQLKDQRLISYFLSWIIGVKSHRSTSVNLQRLLSKRIAKEDLNRLVVVHSKVNLRRVEVILLLMTSRELRKRSKRSLNVKIRKNNIYL